MKIPPNIAKYWVLPKPCLNSDGMEMEMPPKCNLTRADTRREVPKMAPAVSLSHDVSDKSKVNKGCGDCSHDTVSEDSHKK